MKNIELFNGDALEIMDKLIADGVIVDAIITDPPYNIGISKEWDKFNSDDEYINFIGIELDEKYFTIASERINKPKDTLF